MIYWFRWVLPVFFYIVFSAQLHGQNNDLENTLITINIENKSLPEALDILEEEYNLKFSYDSRIIPKSKIVYTKVSEASLDRFLKALLNGVDLDYRIIDDNIVLYYSPQPEVIKEEIPMTDSQTFRKYGVNTETQPDDLDTESTELRQTITIYDTIRHTINDTLIEVVYDTFQINIIDTIVFYDTIKVETKPIIKQTAPIPKYSFGPSVGYQFLTNKQNVVFVSDGMETSSNQNHAEIERQISVNIESEYYFKRYSISFTPGITYCRKKISYNFTASGWREVEFLADSYYEIVGSDTNWVDVYAMESRFIYDTLNGSDYYTKQYSLSLPIGINVPLYSTQQIQSAITAGITPSILIFEKTGNKSGGLQYYHISQKAFSVSIFVAARLRYYINKNYSVDFKISYDEHLSLNHRSLGFSLGLSRLIY